MSQRRRLNSLRWRAVGWMEWDFRRLMLLDVSMCLVVLFSDFGINTNPKILCQKTCSRPTTSRRPFSNEGEEPLLCRRSLQTTFKHQEEESPLLRCEIVFTMQVCMQEDQLCAFPSTDDSEGTAYAGQENMFLGRSNNGLLCCSQTSPDLQWSDSGRLLIWKQRTRYHQSNTVERHSYRGGGILVWAGISLGGQPACVPWRNRNWS
ncbi:uncharacterized protein TNCV_4357491 [Trichonephila clavipes]|nr:uncharacterized protein TNCV_4357491 [Trichonephila clavipes]